MSIYPGFDSFLPELEVEEPEWLHQGPEPESRPDPLVLRAQVLENLSLVYDPEIPVNIVDLGLIYRVSVSKGGDVAIEMTLTAPNCPVAGSLPAMVEKGAEAVPGVVGATVDLTWDPPWSLEMASPDARLVLGM